MRYTPPNGIPCLVVEDEPDTVVLLKHVLRSAGFNVMGAFSGSEAIKKCAESSRT
jgi:CheY-like chemotaxis protein